MTKTNPSRIAGLHDDLLIYIFNLNAHSHYWNELGHGCNNTLAESIPHTSALDTTRHTSQVCRSWRDLLIHSPSIWRDLLDLASLCKASDRWINEVLRRTKDASLSIYGHVPGFEQRSLFISLMDAQWHRLRKLDVTICDLEGLEKTMDNDRWDTIWKRPAPSLEEFLWRVRFDGFTKHNLQLFPASSPTLRNMPLSFPFYFDHSYRWISQLTSLALSHPSLKTGDVLKVISGCGPRLESLVIDQTFVGDDDDKNISMWTHEQHVALPHLSRIEISSGVVGSFLYLSRITPRSDCVLVLMIYEFTAPDVGIMRQLADLVLPYTRHYFKFYDPRVLNIDIANRYISVHPDPTSEPDVPPPQSPRFTVSVTLNAHAIIDPEVVDILLSTLSSVNLHRVGTLTLALTHLTWSMRHSTSLHILCSMTSITRIRLTPWAFQTLDFLPDPAGIFPRLMDVVIINGRHEDFFFERRLVRFLLNRREGGNAVGSLDLTGYPYVRGEDTLGFLGRIEGLEVVYQDSGGQVHRTIICRNDRR